MSDGRSHDGPMFETVLGVRFLNADVRDALALLERGGLMVVPSAPVMTMLDKDEQCRRAIESSDFAIVDSAYLASLWWLYKRRRLKRTSGLKFLRAFIASDMARKRGDLFLVNPTDDDRDQNLALLRSNGFEIDEALCYTAPNYNKRCVEDEELLTRLEKHRPRFVMLNVGGGVQEPLGRFLKARLSYLPGIICTGAAIAFLTGRQASISPRADALGAGWLLRSLSDPKRFVPRYAASLRLASMIFRYGSEMPPLVSRA
jgi:N-acetylglucosaminyldiphosphoundecaprenol N-acetyl-beta-D-mannosaminyltransferase